MVVSCAPLLTASGLHNLVSLSAGGNHTATPPATRCDTPPGGALGLDSSAVFLRHLQRPRNRLLPGDVALRLPAAGDSSQHSQQPLLNTPAYTRAVAARCLSLPYWTPTWPARARMCAACRPSHLRVDHPRSAWVPAVAPATRSPPSAKALLLVGLPAAGRRNRHATPLARLLEARRRRRARAAAAPMAQANSSSRPSMCRRVRRAW